MLKDKEAFLEELLRGIKRAEERNKRAVLKWGQEIDINTVNYIKKYFEDKPQYHIEIIPNCGGCKNKWDVTIYFRA